MKKYKCLIVDDEELARELIATHVSQLPDFEIVATCASALEANTVLKNNAIDLLFLDIEMPVLKGTEFYNNLISKPQVIFTTAYRDYAVEGFELNALDYLIKPITFSRFFKAIERFLATQNSEKESLPIVNETLHKNYIFVTEDRKQVKIFLDDILYVESVKNYIKIITQRKTHIVKHSISSFENLLDNKFIRVHRSYIINTAKITAYTKQDIEIGDIEIPIGDNYKQDVLNALML